MLFFQICLMVLFSIIIYNIKYVSVIYMCIPCVCTIYVICNCIIFCSTPSVYQCPSVVSSFRFKLEAFGAWFILFSPLTHYKLLLGTTVLRKVSFETEPHCKRWSTKNKTIINASVRWGSKYIQTDDSTGMLWNKVSEHCRPCIITGAFLFSMSFVDIMGKKNILQETPLSEEHVSALGKRCLLKSSVSWGGNLK